MADVIKLPSIPDQPVEVPKEENFSEEQKDHRTSQSQGQSTNSHHHDSEYDTASDLEGGDDDDYDDEDDESLGADGEEGEEDDIDESENGSIVFDLERQRGDGQETDYSKKVDEDRSNPQYIPKKGTFYEHDDRTADDAEGNEHRAEEGGDGDTTKSSTPTISASSKTLKKWLPASAVDRWSHDRYDENEQAPKSRAELVSAYGYDIRNEDGPPRARRRRRYGRGPTKYQRNWADENAYIKQSVNTQRKPRLEDFPALGEKKRKPRSFREEKENRFDRHNERSDHRNGGNSSQREGKPERRNSGKSFRSGGRQSMDFKNQNKNRSVNDNSNKNSSVRSGEKSDNIRHSVDDPKSQVESVSFTNTKAVTNNQNDRYNGHEAVHISQMSGPRELKDKMSNLSSSNLISNRQPSQTSQIASRLQIQNRNDPSHVGSVQMHSLVTQNQPEMQQTSTESGKTKRYSSLRQRSQNDSAVPTQNTQIDQHSLQQIQLHEHHQQQQQQQPQTQHVLLQDQHLLQANLMQLYHTQENLQAQMQGVTIQSLPTGHQAKPQFQNVQQQYQTATQGTPTYYAPVTEYAAAAAASAATPPGPQPQYTQQQPTAYIQQPTSTPQIAYNAQSPPPGPPVTQPIPTALNYVQAPPNPATSPPYQNYPGYHQNFNTVGGTTYFVPQQQPPPRPVVIPQRRPTNAIPILAPPSDKGKKTQGEREEENRSVSSSSSNAPIGSAENIDHILDNMFVQRPPYQPPTSRKSSSPATESVGTSTSSVNEDKSPSNSSGGNEPSSTQNRLEESIKNLSLTEEPKSLPISEHPVQQAPATLPVASPSEVAQNETG